MTCCFTCTIAPLNEIPLLTLLMQVFLPGFFLECFTVTVFLVAPPLIELPLPIVPEIFAPVTVNLSVRLTELAFAGNERQSCDSPSNCTFVGSFDLLSATPVENATRAVPFPIRFFLEP